MLLGSPARAARVESYVGVKLFPNTNSEEVFSNQAEEGGRLCKPALQLPMADWLGLGLGKSIQRNFLPAPYNDFIYAIIAEEYGLIGAFTLLGALFVDPVSRVTENLRDTRRIHWVCFWPWVVVVMLTLYGFCARWGVFKPVTP